MPPLTSPTTANANAAAATSTPATADAPLVPNISCHAWSHDHSLVALSPNSNEVHIYSTNQQPHDVSQWQRKYVLDEHSSFVSGIDWSPVNQQIVTCGHDRNAYVWKYDATTDKWQPTLVLLRVNRAATCVKWSPDGKKFAVGSGAKQVAVCHYEASNDWWISKMIKKFKSTVLSVDWSSNSKLLITGGSDNKCRVFSVYMSGVDEVTSSSASGSNGVASNAASSAADEVFSKLWPTATQSFGELLCEVDGTAWVNSVAWNQSAVNPQDSCRQAAYATHNSAITFITFHNEASSEQPYALQTIQQPTGGLPYLSLVFTSNTTLLAAGYDCNIDVYELSTNTQQWAFSRKVDTSGTNLLTPVKQAVTSTFSAAKSLFGDVVQKGAKFGAKAEADSVATRHKNTIVNIWLLTNPASSATQPTNKFSTAGLDGRVCVWDLSDGATTISKLTDAVKQVAI